MGHRANFVVIENGAATVYYDQWGAMGCAYTFAAGPGPAAEVLSAMEETTELMDWAFAEGGYLIDRDQNVAIVFGGAFGDPEMYEELDEEVAAPMLELDAALEQGPRKFLEHIAPAWPGWKLVWDERGTDAFAAHLRARGITSIELLPDSHPADTAPPETLQA